MNNQMRIMHLEVLLMPNGEILCLGKTIGWLGDFKKVLKDPIAEQLDQDWLNVEEK